MIERILAAVSAAILFGTGAVLLGLPWWGILTTMWSVFLVALLVVHAMDSLETVYDLDSLIEEFDPEDSK